MAAAAILYVKNLPQMQYFYENCFALQPVQSEGEAFCVLVSDEWELSLVTLPADAAANVVIADPPERRAGTPVKLAFVVASLEGLEPTVLSAGGRMDAGKSAWEFRGQRRLDCLDPEGNVVEERQLVAT
jgi:hypothetical protein